ncbi:MAG TPA: o-succinylbenzoate synthase [Candidatus Saccharimonadales bacterium]|nr:o-succinylbenzoate synthase [Candidatus Saccharimonadales bacterium]
MEKIVINKAEIYKIKLPLQKPFRTGFGELKDREIVFVKLYDKISGLWGLGETANLELPIYEPEFNDGSILLLKNYLLPNLIGKVLGSIEDLELFYSNIRGNNFAKVGIEAAYWHLVSQIKNKPLRKLWGGIKNLIPVGISIGMGTDLKDSISRVVNYIDTFKPERAKIKIKPGIDVKLIEAIRNQYSNLPLTVDANASFSPIDEKIFLKLDNYNLTMIEQPYAFNDLVNHSILQKKIKTPICLDESINSLAVAEQAIALESCKIINIKPQRIGGYWTAKKLSELAERNNIKVWCGGMIESGWGQLFNSHIASLPNFVYENDICLTKWYLADDILEKEIPEKDGYIDLEKTDNLFVINKTKFKKYQTLNIEINNR